MRRIYRLGMVLYAVLCVSAQLFAQIDTDRVMTIGKNAVSFKDYVLAIQYFNTVIRYSPEKADAYYYRGVAKYSLDDLHGTEEDCTLSLERNPYVYSAYFLRALARQSLHRDSLALEDYKVVLYNDPDDQGALHNIALLYIAKGDTLSAHQTLSHLKRFHPRYAPAYLIEGSLALSKGDTLSAQKLCQKAIELQPASHVGYELLSKIAYTQRDYRSSLSYLNQALLYNSSSTDLYALRGIVNFQLNNLRGAMADYGTAIELKPSNLMALYNRALLRSRVGEIRESISDFNQLLQYEPQNTFALFNRALLHNDLGEYRQARKDLDIIIYRYPDFEYAYLLRASVRRALGDSRGAEIDMYYASRLMNDPRARARLQRKSGGLRSSDLTEDPSTKDTRDAEDQNIHKYRMLVHDSRGQGYNELHENDGHLRGRVQDRNVAIKPEPMYILSYYESEQRGLTDAIEYKGQYGRLHTDYALKLVRKVPLLPEPIIAEHQRRLEDHLPLEDEDSIFRRAMDYVTLRDYQGAIDLLARIIDISSSSLSALARFQSATAIMYLFELEQLREDSVGEKKSEIVSRSMIYTARLKQLSTQAIRHLETLLSIYPEDAMIRYNLACVYHHIGAYDKAIEMFTHVIRADSSIASAYFNRALCYYAMGDVTHANQDMSTAGAKGLYKAYSIIKRMQ